MTEGNPVRHSLVCRNPDNGRDYLFVNVPIFCRSITGMENPEGDALLASLYEPCLSGCNPHPLYVGCAVIRQARVSEWKLMF